MLGQFLNVAQEIPANLRWRVLGPNADSVTDPTVSVITATVDDGQQNQ